MKNNLLLGLALILTISVTTIFTGCSSDSKTAETTEILEGYDLSWMDTTASPCEDFYQYAAGAWMDNNPVPETESRWGIFNVLSKDIDNKLKTILEEADQSIDKQVGSPKQLVGDFYASAIDTATTNKLGNQPLLKEWEIMNELNSKNDLGQILGKLKKRGYGGFFGFYVATDPKNSEVYLPGISQGGLSMPDRDYYLKADKAEIRKEFLSYSEMMFELAGEQNPKNAAATVLKIETKLAQLSMTREERRDPDKIYNKMSVAALQTDYNLFDWNDFFTHIGAPAFPEINVAQVAYFKGLEAVLKDAKIEEIKIYLKWHMLSRLSSQLSKPFVMEHFRFNHQVMKGTQKMKPRWERSVSMVNGALGEPLGQLFVEQHFGPESKQKVSEMVEDLRTAFKTRIENLEWMSPETKEKALEKLAAFGYKIGYPDKWKDYSMVVITKDKLVENTINCAIRNFEIMVEKIGKPVDKTEWGMTPQTVNAYYNSSYNEIVFPAGILQPPFFDPKADDALNYGGIGAVIGHEFSHGFDDKGSKFDGKGNRSNWWTAEDSTRFKERTEMIVQQFNRFEVLDSVFINGNMTQGENIADLAGLTLAYHALKLKRDENTPEPNDGFTWQQRLFLGWARVWAQNINEQELRNRIITDPHSPGKYRVIGPLANMPEFWEAFGCQSGQPMRAIEEYRVVIW
jgi:putative endopeptidase